jgi:hypothetical protein
VNIPILSGHCEVAQRIAERIGLAEELRENLGQIYERWDGRGLPRGLAGEAVKFPVRLVTLAQDVIALVDIHGFENMTAMIAKRAGGAYEPELAQVFLTHAETLRITATHAWTGVSTCPSRRRSARVSHPRTGAMSVVSNSRCMATRAAAPAAATRSPALTRSAYTRSHTSMVTSRWPAA